MTWRLTQVDDAFGRQLDKIDRLVDISFNPTLWCLTHLNYSPFDNQIDIIEKILDWSCKYIMIVGTRSSGKSDGTCAGLLKLCVENPNLSVGVFAPKLEQSTRLLKRCKEIMNNSPLKDKVVWLKSTQQRLEFENGSYMVGQSANEVSMTEGGHYDILVIDEAQLVSDISVSQKLLPMIASSHVGKVIKLGVALYKNHFWRAFKDPQYTQLIFDWTKCPNLLKGGSIVVKGKEYSKYVIDRMPLSIKRDIFPDNPELWIHTSDTSEIDFRTQYLIEWQEDLNLVLSEVDQKQLVDGNHSWLEYGLITDTYYAGLDTAGGSTKSLDTDLDYTSLSIWRRTNNGTKEKIHHQEWRGDYSQSVNEIYELINPASGKFKCKLIIVDYSNVGISLVEEYKKLGVPIEGITFQSTDRASGKNLKNAMVDEFLYELRASRLYYPKSDIDRIKILKKAESEWHMMERHKGLGINDKLFVPTQSGHDDAVCADLMAVWAADKYETFIKKNPTVLSRDLPGPISVRSASNPAVGQTQRPWWLENWPR